MESIINIENLNVKYQRTSALEDIDLAIPTNIRGAIIGPNGAGKSTLIKAVLELIPRQSGQVTFFNNISIKEARQKIAYVPQTSEVNWYFPTTVRDVVSMGINRNSGLFRKYSQSDLDRIDYALEKMNLQDNQKRQISQLSGGQKQRVFLARAIAQEADLYLLDEPLAGVDMTSEAIIMDQIQQFQEQGKTSLTVHHDLNTIKQYFDYVIFLNKRIITHGPVATTFTQENIDRTYTMMEENQNQAEQTRQQLSFQRGDNFV